MAVKNVSLESIGNILKTPFITLSSRSLIKAGWKGDIGDFSKKLWKYRWQGTRDYTMAVIMITVVVAASKAKDVNVSVKTRDAEGNKTDKYEEISLADYINRKVSARKIADLFKKIVNIWSVGNIHSIASSISQSEKTHGWFAKCFINLLLASRNDREEAEKVFEKFLKQVKKMTPWKINESYIQELTKIINKLLTTNIHPTADDQPEPKPEPEPEPESKSEPDHWAPICDYLKKNLTYYDGHINKKPSAYIIPDNPSFAMMMNCTCSAERGWKLHISPKPLYAAKVFEIFVRLQKKMKFMSKFVHSGKTYQRRFTSGNQAGKFITIYPNDDAQSKKIAENFHKEFEKSGMSTSCFIKVPNEFEVYPGIYTRLCDYGDKISKNSRYRLGIPDKFLRIFQRAGDEKKVHPFDKLSIDGIEMPKNLFEINAKIMDKLISKSTWEPLTNESQIPDDSEFECVVPHKAWGEVALKYFFAIAKVQLPGHSDFKIVLVPQDVDLYCRVTDFNQVKEKSEKLLPNLIKCLEQRKEVIRIKTVAITREEPKKENLCFVKNPIIFLKGIQKEMKNWKEK